MNFKEFPREEYKENILFEVIFQARFPEIMKISREEPVDFQEKIRKHYPESGLNIPSLPKDMPEEIKKLITSDKEFFFFSEEKDWQISLAKNFIALSCKGKYLNYADFRARLEEILKIFNTVYEPSYFTRIGLRYRNIVNDELLISLNGRNIRKLIPDKIFPELKEENSENTKSLEKTIHLDDGNIKINATYALATVSGEFGQKQINNKESYIIDIDCFIEEKTKGVKNVLTKCDEFKENEWNIFQWSITDDLRRAMGKK